MTDRNITREIAEQCGVELKPRSEWTDEQKIKWDRLVYGTGCWRLRPDGSQEHVPIEDLVFEYNNGPTIAFRGFKK
jgi:hypothetical protein